MLDLAFVRDHPEEVRKAAKLKGFAVDVEAVLTLDEERRRLQAEFDRIRADKHKAGGQLSGLSREARRRALAVLKTLDRKEEAIRPKLAEIEEKLTRALATLPNPPLPGVPEGSGEEDNVELKRWGTIKPFDFPALDHVQLASRLDFVDFERGSKVAGSGFYFLKNEAVLLEFALVRYALDVLQQRGFTLWVTPDLSRSRFYLGTGYLPRGPEAQIYEIREEDLGLIATAEVTLAGLHADEVLAVDDLPRRYAGYSHCFRKEAGSYGKYAKGLYRVHQFTKVEMFAYTTPDQSSALHEEFLRVEEELWQGLGIPYRVVEMCTGELGAQAARKFDLEAWMPGRGGWGEVTSTSNTTDYQARRLNVRYRTKEGSIAYVHTLNGTAIATSRALIAILENYQQKDGSVAIPEVLRSYLGGLAKISRRR